MKTIINYYYGIYKDYQEKIKVAQLTDDIDCLSCEILAQPGVESFMEDNKNRAIINARLRAKRDNCNLLEINLKKYQLIKI